MPKDQREGWKLFLNEIHNKKISTVISLRIDGKKLTVELTTEKVRQVFHVEVEIDRFWEAERVTRITAVTKLETVFVSIQFINGGGFLQILLGDLRKRKCGASS